ncbi:uracil-DNA glycosylase family protein [Crenobacter sp. SG2303]|uniref:Uracil-DNA glycosylase family protein n=1 Tax=Crenobacter oryzisoli TaxID=3056844 RepID=A0ABT7XTH9_9NEIS|nr:uracil-DNA glycosylase family protein [Crenobacter sp. SG2303]MDN0077103.1 uracil-DNA glycosylase family protein [Crenobacter sp. SG2303]
MATALDQLLDDIRACRHCEAVLPLGPHPVVQASPTARLLIVGQAPGTRVHATGIPFNDPSGDRLRDWLGLDRTTFYDPAQVAIVPMAFCYPGKKGSGDAPPRPECAALWRQRLLAELPEIRLTLLIGQYAQAWHLGALRKKTLTDTVRAWRDYLPSQFVLPHPSPRNIGWFARNPWFAQETIPALRAAVRLAMAQEG